MTSKYQILISEVLVNELSGIAVDYNVYAVETLVDAMLREKIFALTGRKLPSCVSLTQDIHDKEEENLTRSLREAVVKTGMSTFNETSLGPDVQQAPEQYTDAFMDPLPAQQNPAQQNPAPQQGVANHQQIPINQQPRQQDLETIAAQQQKIAELSNLVNTQQQHLHPQGVQSPFGTRQR